MRLIYNNFMCSGWSLPWFYQWHCAARSASARCGFPDFFVPCAFMSCFIENWRCLSKLSLLPTMMALNKCFGWGLDNYDLQLTIPNHLYPPARLFSWHHLGHYFWEGRLYLGIGIFTMRYLYRRFCTARWSNIFFSKHGIEILK